MTAQDVPVPAVNDHDSAVDVPPPLAGDLYQKIREGTAKVGVVGLGYVGLPTMVAAVAGGFKVTGIDVDKARADQINAGQSYIEDVDSATLASMVGEEKISATTDPTVLETLDVIVICVPTPVNKHKEPELGALQDAVHTVAAHMRPIHDAHGRSFDDPDPATLGSAADRGEQLVILQSTSYPGTTEELVLPLLKGPGREVGREFYLAFSPERIDPGNRQFFVNNIPKVVGGVTPQCSRMAAAFFSAFVEQVIPVSSPKVAEMTKLLENIFRSVNIALANEMAEVCRRMGIDIWEVIHAASTKPFGFMPFYPGIGVGGHCISVDPFYLSWKAKEYDFYVNFIELAARTNDNMPYYAVSRIADILANEGATIRGARLLLLGVSFKKDIGDTRNSPAMRVAELLLEKGATVAYSDRHAPEVTIGGCPMKSVELDEATLPSHDATVILVDHSYYDLEMIVRHSKLVIDTRDATRRLGPQPTVVKL